MSESDLPSTPQHDHQSLVGRLRAYFFAGILVVAPLSVTLYIAWLFIDFFDRQVTPLIPAPWNPRAYGIPGVGLLLVVVGLTLLGATTAGIAGRIWMRVSEAVMARTPVLRGIYSAVKQLFEAALAQKSQAFREVALIEYPRRGIWTLAFITGPALRQINRLAGDDLVNVFVPTTPNPTSGFLLFLPRADLRVLDMTVEEGLKLVVSTGIVAPVEKEAEAEAEEPAVGG